MHKEERSDSEKDKDIRSEDDYWEDIEPRMSKHARLLDLSKTCGTAIPLTHLNNEERMKRQEQLNNERRRQQTMAVKAVKSKEKKTKTVD